MMETVRGGKSNVPDMQGNVRPTGPSSEEVTIPASLPAAAPAAPAPDSSAATTLPAASVPTTSTPGL